tara:strand:+ start:240 stop:359 length:120 start_codon:yes stop_codon:yes gene_type:complete
MSEDLPPSKESANHLIRQIKNIIDQSNSLKKEHIETKEN